MSSPTTERQALIARFLLGQILGTAFGQSVAGVLAEQVGWRAIFVVLAALYLIVGTLLLLELRRNPITRHPAGDATATIRSGPRAHGPIARAPWVRFVVGTVFVEAMIMYGALRFLPAHLQQRFSPRPRRCRRNGRGLRGGRSAVRPRRKTLRRAAGRIRPRGGRRPGSRRRLFLARIRDAGMGKRARHFCLSAPAFTCCTIRCRSTPPGWRPRRAARDVPCSRCACLAGQWSGVWLAGKVVDAYGTGPVFVAASLGLALIGCGFRWRLNLERDRRAPKGL